MMMGFYWLAIIGLIVRVGMRNQGAVGQTVKVEVDRLIEA